MVGDGARSSLITTIITTICWNTDNVTSGYLQLEVLHLNAFGTHSWEILGVIRGQLIYGTMY